MQTYYAIPENKVKLTLFLTYITAILAGYAFPLAGILSPQIAKSLSVRSSDIVFLDALILIGLLAGNTVSGKLMRLFGGKKTLALSAFLLMAVQVGLSVQSSVRIYAPLVFLNGAFMGMLIPSVNYLIVSAVSRYGQSDSKLNIMNFFVGIGCFIGTGTAGMIVFHSSWRIVFVITALLFLSICVTAYNVNINEITGRKDVSAEVSGEHGKRGSITAPVILTGLALIFYVYAEYIITYWFSPYLQESIHFNVRDVGFMIGLFWLVMALGRLFFGVAVLAKANDYVFLIVVSLLTAAGFFSFLFSGSTAAFYASIIILGIGCSAIYPTLIGYGMKVSGATSPFTMAFLTCCGSLGGVMSLASSAVIGSHFAKVTVIYTGPFWCLLIILFLFAGRRYVYKCSNSSNR